MQCAMASDFSDIKVHILVNLDGEHNNILGGKYLCILYGSCAERNVSCSQTWISKILLEMSWLLLSDLKQNSQWAQAKTNLP
jgi:hypothetical protein